MSNKAVDEWQNIYILNVHPLIINESIVLDVFYLTESSTSVNCLRIYNLYLSFQVAKLPGLRFDQFIRYLSDYTKDLHVELRKDLVDAGFFSFGINWEYLEIFSQNPFELKEIYKSLFKDFKPFYSKINPDKLPSMDKIFYRNTETPFRYTSTTINFQNTPYYLSTKYKIPLVGGAKLNTTNLTSNYPMDFLPASIDSSNIYGLDAQLSSSVCKSLFQTYNNEYLKEKEYESQLTPEQLTQLKRQRRILNKPLINPNSHISGVKTNWNYQNVNGNITASIKSDDTVDFKCNMTMLSYDIETYNENGNLDPTIKENYIFAIGIGIFNMTDQKPKSRLCIISKDFDSLAPKSPLNHKTITIVPSQRKFGCKTYLAYNEYTESMSDDFTTYIIAQNEKHLLITFMNIIHEYQPQIINGFNSFAFDDNYVYERLKLYELTSQFEALFTYYDISELSAQKWFKFFQPQFKEFELKIDGEQRKDNKSMRSPLILTVDVRKLMLKEDPKRFTAYGRGNLDTMLETYKVLNPYTQSPLSKTGLKIHEMYSKWLANKDIYEIALYCCQDAWICGTLLVKRAKIADLIELGGVSNTTFSDSIYRADGNRVANMKLGYAYQNKFAMMDTPFEHRDKIKHHEEGYVQYGGKQFDHRTIVGGAVRCVHAGRHLAIMAEDYASAYPAGKEGNNIDSSSRVDEYIMSHLNEFGLKEVAHKIINEPTDLKDIHFIKITE